MPVMGKHTVALLLAIVNLTIFQIDAAVKWKKNMKSFSHVMKQGKCFGNKEVVLFEHKKGPGVITEQWYTGPKCFDENSRVLIYVDGETTPSINMNLYMGHGIGFVKKPTKVPNPDYIDNDKLWMTKDEDPGVPWGGKRIGHLASGGGLYNTYRIPFEKSIKITVISTVDDVYWYIVRGVENYPVIIGDVELPASAKLKLYALDKVKIKPFYYVALASTKEKAGMLYKVAFASKSKNLYQQEACFRAVIDNDNNVQYLSSGTEDLFMSAFYYDQGIYHTEQAGTTFMDFPGTMSAYKFFEDDPIFFTKSFQLLWRCGELVDNECFGAKQRKCTSRDNKTYCDTEAETKSFFHNDRMNKEVVETTISAYVWIYEWDPEA
eukprot:gene17318-19051_t